MNKWRTQIEKIIYLLQNKLFMKKIKKLKGRKIISNLFENGLSYEYNSLTIFYLKEKKPINFVYFSVSVPKKVHKTAVARNRIKRLIRESVYAYDFSPFLLSNSFYFMLIYSNTRILTFNETKNLSHTLFSKCFHSKQIICWCGIPSSKYSFPVHLKFNFL